MLRPYWKLIITYFVILYGIFVGFRILRADFTGEVVDLSVLVTGSLWVVVFCLVYWAYLVKRFRPRLKYVESPGTQLPDLTGVIVSRRSWRWDDFPLEKLRDVLSKKLVVTFSDDSERVIKVRSRFTVWTWGACSMIHWQPDKGRVTVATYPMANHTIRQGKEGEKQHAAITGFLDWLQRKREESNEL